MRELGGRPHWAKNFESDAQEMEGMYGKHLKEWRKVRESVDPEGMFLGAWHRRYLLNGGKGLELEEREVQRRKLWKGGVRIVGEIGGEVGGEIGEEVGGKEALSGHGSEDSFEHLRGSEFR